MKAIRPYLWLCVLLFAVACASTGLPRGAYVVGGGARISFNPPGDGTVVLVEKRSGKVVATRSSTDGVFEFDISSERDSALVTALFGDSLTNAQFVLYFAPERQ